MGSDASKLPQLGAIIILLLNEVEDLILSENVLILIIIDQTVELEVISIVVGGSFMVFNSLNNASSEPPAIFPGSKEECSSHKVGRIEHLELR